MPKWVRDDALMILWSIWMKETHGNVFWSGVFHFGRYPNIEGDSSVFAKKKNHPPKRVPKGKRLFCLFFRRLVLDVLEIDGDKWNPLYFKSVRMDIKQAIIQKKGTRGHSKAILGSMLR